MDFSIIDGNFTLRNQWHHCCFSDSPLLLKGRSVAMLIPLSCVKADSELVFRKGRQECLPHSIVAQTFLSVRTEDRI